MKAATGRIRAGAVVIGLVIGGVVSVTPPATADSALDASTDLLADSTDGQQRWLSVPGSRIVLNPFDFDGSGSELDQTAGVELPLHLGYYANDEAIQQEHLVDAYATSADAGDRSAYRSALSESFDEVDDWTTHGASARAESGIATLALDGANEWGHMERIVEVPDASITRYLTIDIASVGPGSTWNVKIGGDGGDDLPELQADSSETGVATFDLADAYGWEPGPRTIAVKVYAVNKSGEPGGSIDIRSLALHNGDELPWADWSEGVIDDFSEVSAWSTAVSSGRSASIGSDGGQGTVRLGNDGFGAVERQMTVDLDLTPLLSVRAASTTGEWALKLSTGSGSDITLQPDTSRTGIATYDVAAATGWSGEHAFSVKLFHIGAGGRSTFDDLGFHEGTPWLRTASSFANGWRPEALESHGEYADGAIDVVDAFHDEDSFSRTVRATTDGAAVAGAYEGTATYDPGAELITIAGEHHTYSIALPDGAGVGFGASVSDLAFNAGAAEPVDGDAGWVATLPDGEDAVVGIGVAVNDTSVSADPVRESQERAAAAAKDPAGDRTVWQAYWNDFLHSVPKVQDFSIQRVADGGVAADEMRRFWFSAWVNLEMNVLPATPETGNDYAQLGTGKPSMWMHGTPGTRNVASWDSLLGMQQLVYVDPENAWASFQGMMALVEDDPLATEPSDEEYGTRGELGGESLPSRKAQTAWVLYSVTGDRERLASVYDELALHLNWERYNMRWVLGENNHFDERDSEFVTSLAYDLEFAMKIADELGHDADVAHYESVISEITAAYSDWFFPTAADGDGKVWDTVQKIYLDSSREEVPFGDDTEGEPFRNENGQWIRAGFSFYTSTAFVMDELDEDSMAAVMARFLDDYDENAQLAGLGDFAVKAPDIQLLTYGLLDMEPVSGATEPELRDHATVLINSIIRDMVRSGWFAEVYFATGEPGDPVGARGVRPSLFGISNYIDFVLMANGVRTDGGDPAFVRLAGATGGVSGLTHLGQQFDVDLVGDTMQFSGAAVPAECAAIRVDEGQTVTWDADCGASEPEGPGEPDGSGSGGGDASSDGTAGDAGGALAATGADGSAASLLVALALAFALAGLALVGRGRRSGAVKASPPGDRRDL